MHELSIASAILDTVQTEARRRPGARITKVGVRIGELSGVDPEALSFGFDALQQGTGLEPLALEIDYRPRRQRCGNCQREFVVSDYRVSCPACGATDTCCIGGDELEVAYLELEES